MQAKERKENRLEGQGYIDDDDVSTIAASTVSMCLRRQREKRSG